ncbi:MAG: orotidine-5-phosphate decarboxylase [Clostridiales bacterium]|nr:orotidine-5-phosphate decarboxylase [Clostridiales bacterium]
MIEQLVKKIQKTEAPIVVGLDPMLDYIPAFIQTEAFEAYGETLEGAAQAILQYNKGIIDTIYDLVPCVKPQIAMYEQFGIPGLISFQKTVDYAKEKGLLVIGDIKRGDIGSTSKAYATAHLGHVTVGSNKLSAFLEDFATVNPYLGSDGVLPFVEECEKEDKGIFVLVKTSNPSSGEFQDQKVEGTPLYEIVARKVAEWGESLKKPGADYSDVGCVIGATYPQMAKTLRSLMPKQYILVPGYGAQGGTAKDLLPYFNPDGLGAIVNSSRGIIAAYKMKQYEKFGERSYAEAARQAVLDMKQDIQSAIGGRA